MSLLRVLLVLMGSFVAGNCVIYNGTCPTSAFKLHNNFSCINFFSPDKRFKVLAHLPTTNASLNLFHNPLGTVGDIDVQLMCTGVDAGTRQEPETVKFFLSCNETSPKGVKYSRGCNYKSLNTTTHSWSVIKYDDCQPATSYWNSVNIVNYVQNVYAVLWGCRNLSSNSHEQGAWILGNKESFSQSTKYLNQALKVDLSFSSALAKDYIFYNQTSFSANSTASACSSKVCAYNILCKNDVQDSEENL